MSRFTLGRLQTFMADIAEDYGDETWFSIISRNLPYHEFPNEDMQDVEIYIQDRYDDNVDLFLTAKGEESLTARALLDAIDDAIAEFGEEPRVNWVFRDQYDNIIFETDDLDGCEYRIMNDDGDHDVYPF